MDKVLRLVEYLGELVRINTKTIRSLDEYQRILWVHDIPRELKYCFARAWGAEDEHGNDVWIEVKKFREPKPPPVPDACRDWINPEALRNTQDLPDLSKEKIVKREKQNAETGEKFTESETLFLADYPEVQKSWDEYLDKHWLPWTGDYERYNAVQKAYADLFHIYQEQMKLGEQYELVFCLGLLTWRTPSGNDIKRHLVVAKASLEFEPHLGKFSVRPSTEGDQVDIELDMIEVEEQPTNARKLIEEGRATLRDNFWDRSAVDPLLFAIANSLADSGQGEYHKDRMAPQQKSISDKPIVEYAPALILRKRSMRGLQYLLAKMKEQIEAGESATPEFLDLCESLDAGEDQENGEQEEGRIAGETEIYFPLPANEEQRRIIKTLDRQKGVLVQGPPGTGKSHTIANLICHLLATGRRVLVTAKTPRALQVLHDKLPVEIKPLCVALLGSGTEERESLEKSVSGILTRLDQRNEAYVEQRITQLENQLQNNRKEKAEIDNKLMALRESETFKHIVADGAYRGTAAEIARRIKEEAKEYHWFSDRIVPEAALPLSQEEIQSLCGYIVELDAETEKQLSLFIPDPASELPQPDAVRALFWREQEAKQKVEANSEVLNSQESQALILAGREKINELIQCIQELKVATDSTRTKQMRWVPQAVCDVLTEKETTWRELLKLSTSHFEGLQEEAAWVDRFAVAIHPSIDSKKLLHDAKAIKKHFENGGGKGFWIFRPRTMREHGDFLNRVKVDGIECKNADTLRTLINYLTVEERLTYISGRCGLGKLIGLIALFPCRSQKLKASTKLLKISLHSVISGRRQRNP